MPIVFVRVDDRLIHGQITTAWIADTGANKIVIASDEVANDAMMQTIIKVTAPPRIAVEVKTSEQAIKACQSGAWDKDKVFIMCKLPKDAVPLVKAGLPIKEINVGNVGGMTQHTTGVGHQIFKSIAVTPADVACFREILAAGVGVEIRVVPRDHRVDMAPLLEKLP